MNIDTLKSLISETSKYNLHSHTEFCDGRAPMSVMAQAAFAESMEVWGFSPHSPLPVRGGAGDGPIADCFPKPSPCNMKDRDVKSYLLNATRIKEEYDSNMKVLTSMEIDWLCSDWGAHIDFFQKIPLDYRISSVHFVPNQQGYYIDCDGNAESFRKNLNLYYNNDLRYVVERYFEQVLTMIERGGFEVLGHFDKIASNASSIDPEIENQLWFGSLVRDVISHARGAGLIVEINTKSYADKDRFFPDERWWGELFVPGSALLSVAINSDAHYPDKVNAGRQAALDKMSSILQSQSNL